MLIGGVHARYADSISGTAGLTTLRLSGSTPNTAGTFTGSLSKFSSGEWITQISGFGTALKPLGAGVSIGVSAGGDANRVQGGSWNGAVSGGVLGVLSHRNSLVTLGFSVGMVRTVFDSTVGTGVVNARVQQRLGREAVLSGGVVVVTSDTTRYADATLDLLYSHANVRASITGGLRIGDLSDDPWGQGHVEYDVLPHLTFELTLGRYPQNLVGFTDGTYLTFGTRIGITGGARHSAPSDPPVRIVPLENNRVRLKLKFADDAERLEIAGVWNGWLPLRLEKEAGNMWSIELDLEPGIYQYAIVVNGNEWTVPDGVTSEPDDFGGEVATLVVGIKERGEAPEVSAF